MIASELCFGGHQAAGCLSIWHAKNHGCFFLDSCRHSRPVPVSLVPYCQAICYLNDLRRGAHYHYDNCHQLLQRCVLVQDYLLALPHKQLQQKTVMLAQLHLLVQDAYDVFSQFSDR